MEDFKWMIVGDNVGVRFNANFCYTYVTLPYMWYLVQGPMIGWSTFKKPHIVKLVVLTYNFLWACRIYFWPLDIISWCTWLLPTNCIWHNHTWQEFVMIVCLFNTSKQISLTEVTTKLYPSIQQKESHNIIHPCALVPWSWNISIIFCGLLEQSKDIH